MSVAEFTAKELAALKKEQAAGATDEQFELWIADCRLRELIPGRDVLLQLRTVDEYDPAVRAKVKRTKAIYITTIGGIRKLAEGTGKYAGQLPSKWIYLDDKGLPTIESEVPLPDPAKPPYPLLPWAARATILRKDFDAPVSVVARFWAYAQSYTYEGKQVLTAMWSAKGRPAEQLEKCAESLAFRKGFPEQIAGLYIAEELMHNSEDETSPAIPLPIVEPPKVASVPTVNHTPAVPTDAPRPGEAPKSAAETTLVEILVPKAVPEILTPTASPAVRKQRVKKATEKFMADSGRPLPKHEQPVEPNIPIGATDADLPAELFEHDSPSPEPPVSAVAESAPSTETVAPPVQIMDDPPNKDEGKAITEKVRSYYVHGCKPDDLKNFSLKIAGKEKPSEIGKAAWKNIFGQLDAAFTKGGKTILLELIKPKPAAAEEVF